SDGKEYLNIRKAPPTEISILAGEIVYQIRSALDHLVFDLIKVNPAILSIDPEWFEHCEFPLRTKIAVGKQPPLPQKDFSRPLPGISPTAFAFIESVQPYNRRNYSSQGNIPAHLEWLA